MAYDAVNQVIVPGDSIVFFRSGKAHLAVVTEELSQANFLNIDTIRIEFLLQSRWLTQPFGAAPINDIQTVTPVLLRNKLNSNNVIKVTHDTFRTMPMTAKNKWPRLSPANKLLEPRFQLQQAAIFEFLRNNYPVKRLKIPEELKQI